MCSGLRSFHSVRPVDRGFAVSGNPVTDKIFSAIISGPDWITGGRFGAEASVPAVVVGLLLTVVLLCKCKRDDR